jgi:hypothetical protein
VYLGVPRGIPKYHEHTAGYPEVPRATPMYLEVLRGASEYLGVSRGIFVVLRNTPGHPEVPRGTRETPRCLGVFRGSFHGSHCVNTRKY